MGIHKRKLSEGQAGAVCTLCVRLASQRARKVELVTQVALLLAQIQVLCVRWLRAYCHLGERRGRGRRGALAGGSPCEC